jgi:hypothetical protein
MSFDPRCNLGKEETKANGDRNANPVFNIHVHCLSIAERILLFRLHYAGAF